jgi:hypothetical protein
MHQIYPSANKIKSTVANAFILKLGKIITEQYAKSEQFFPGKNGKKNVLPGCIIEQPFQSRAL